MEFQIISPQNNKFANAIEFNYEPLKEYLSMQLQKFRNIHYSDESIGEAKADKASLNKLRTAIENKRKEIKNECMIPYLEFEAKVKELVALIDEPILAIDTQVKAYEDGVKSAKRNAIMEFYEESIGTLRDLLPMTRIWNERWLNVTFSMNNVKEEISGAITKTREDLAVIETLNSEFSLQIKDKYLQTGDLSAALREKTRLEEAKEKMEAYKIEQQKEEKQAEEVKPEVPARETENIRESESEAAPVHVIDFRVWVTPTQKKALMDFFIAQKIRVGKVE